MTDKSNTNSKKDNQEKVWREMERLAFYYINKNFFGTEYDKGENENLTQATKDNGYDAIWEITSPDGEKRIYLMESKMRKLEQASLSLSDCAKAIVIAFNYPAHKLFISTNLKFSPQSLKEIAMFENGSALHIEKITGGQLADFFFANKDLFKVPFSEKLSIAMKDCKGIFNNTAQNIVKTEIQTSDFGARHNAYIDNIYKFLSGASSLVIRGKEGTGKSLIMDAVQEKLRNMNYRTRDVFMDIITSPRALFVTLLEIIWGVNINFLLTERNIKKIKNILNIKKVHLSADIVDAVSNAIVSSTDNFYKYRDSYTQLLINYLQEILDNKNLQISIVFRNINNSQKETLSFLICLVKLLISHGIKMTFEIRDPIITDTAKNELNLKIDELSRLSATKLIEGLDHGYAAEYISKSINNKLNLAHCATLAKLLEYSPLEINTAIIRLKDMPPEFFYRFETCTKEEGLEIFIKENFINASIVPSVITSLLKDSVMREIFALVIILKGYIPYFVIYNYPKEIKDKIAQSMLFSDIGSGFECHLKYQRIIYQNSNSIETYIAANNLYLMVKNKDSDNELKTNTAVYLNILFYAQKTHEYTQNAIMYIQSLMRENVFDEAAKEAKRCLDTTFHISRETEIEILLMFFTCLAAMNMISNSKYDPYWKKLESNLCLCNDFSIERIKYMLLKWEKYFFTGNFEEALSVIKPYYDEIESVPSDIKNDYVGQVIQDYALTIKEQSTGENALEIFEKAIKKFPKSFYPVIQKYSQLGNAALKHNPYQAEKYYKQLIKTAQGTNFPWQGKLHAKIDIVMSMVLDYVKPGCRHHEANEILKYLEKYIAEAEQTNINCQKGRALILKAVMHIADNDFNSAERLLHSANLYLFDTQSNIYRWRAQFTLASLLINTNGDSIQLRQLLASITNTLLMHFACKVRKDKASVVRQVLLASCMYYHQINNSDALNKILSEINDKDFEHDYKRLLSVENWQRTMQSKVMYINNILVAVG